MASYMAFEPDLKKLGLSDKEAAVYLAALGLGPSPVQLIARKAKVARATTYLVLDALVQSGLVTKYESEGKTVFSADNPLQLERILEKREEHLQESRRDLEELLPRLQAYVRTADDRPIVRYYEGLEGLKRIRSEMALWSKANETWLHFTSADHLRRVFAGNDFSFEKTRVARRIQARSIFTTTSQTLKEELLQNSDKYIQRKFLPPSQYHSASGMTIFQDKIAIGSFGEKLGGMIIESEAVAGMMREFFEALWNRLDGE